LFNAFFLLALVPVSLVPKDIISISLAFLFESGFGLSNLPNLWIKSLPLPPVPLTIILSCASGTSTPSSKTLDVTMALYLPFLNRSQLREEGIVLLTRHNTYRRGSILQCERSKSNKGYLIKGYFYRFKVLLLFSLFFLLLLIIEYTGYC
jgi:hypothetical protein